MSGQGCSVVDSSLPETFLHDRITFQDRPKTTSPASFALGCNLPTQTKGFDSLIDFYKDPVVGLCSSFMWNGEENNVAQPREDRCTIKKKSSSLKAPNSNNTNGEKKIVRFADVLGLDLADVHTFLDEIPRIPKSAFKDLKNIDIAPPSPPKSEKTLVALFVQPASQPQFTELLARNKVCLENAFVTNTISLNVRGTIRVVNIDFEKKVAVRYSLDKWKSFTDMPSQYLECSSDGFSDRFSFTISSSGLTVGQRLEFAVRYAVSGAEFWDNNSGANYAFQCVPDAPPKPVTSAYIPSTLALESWGSFY